MAKFQFKIITGASETICKQKYDNLLDPTKNPSAIVDPNDSTKYIHDPYTFYLFDQGGVGYLGDTPLFGGDSSKFNFISGNTDKDALKPEEIYFATADCTITDTSTEPDTTYNVKAGTIWLTNASKVPSELSWTSFNTYMARYITASVIQSDGTNLPSGDAWDETFAGDDDTLLTSAATRTLIDNVINAQAILNISFFKDAKSVTLTAADIASNPKVVTFQIGTDSETGDPITATAPLSAEDHEGDVGLVFQVQYGDEYDPTEADDDGWVFVNLHGLIDTYVPDSSALTTQTTIADDNTGIAGHRTKKIKVEVNQSNKTGPQFEAMVLAAIDTVNNNGTYDPTDSAGDNLSPNKFISESQLAAILVELLDHFTQYGTISGEGGTVSGEEEG